MVHSRPVADAPIGHPLAVPYRAAAAAVGARWLPGDPCVAEVAARLETVFAAECGALEERLKAAYAPIGSDTEGRPTDDGARLAAFVEGFGALLVRAGYRVLAREALERAATEHALPGLAIRVDLGGYDHLALWVKGEGRATRDVRAWRRGGRRQTVAIPSHARVVLCARLRDEPGLHLKLFRDVPELDVELLLPNTTLKMRWIDHLKIGGSGGATLVSLGIRAATAALAPMLLVLGGTVYAGTTIWRYVQARDGYRARLLKEVFFQMLDSGVGVLTRLVDEAEEEEAKEALLAWAALVAEGPADAATVRARVEAHARAAHGETIAFDVADALGKLARLGLAVPLGDAGPDGPFRALPPGAAAVALQGVQVRASSQF